MSALFNCIPSPGFNKLTNIFRLTPLIHHSDEEERVERNTGANNYDDNNDNDSHNSAAIIEVVDESEVKSDPLADM
jgi:hypothetical protein